MSAASPSLANDQTARHRLRSWLQRHDRELAKRAVADIEDADALDEGARHQAVSATQLRALQNTATMCSLSDLRENYVQKRQKRRAETDEQESAFWDALDGALGALEEDYAPAAIEACGAPETTPDTARRDTLDHRAVKALVARRYLSHFVAHCQYLQRL